ncbi:MAG TPA: VCBS repeat-containing protein [Steroidobacteraceae bacterium]|nr:VCBS repeat-containing protein [Steroidobacteraceae bacterium]
MNASNRWTGRTSLALLSVAALSACHDDHRVIDFAPTQIEYGLAVADFNGDGIADVVSARTLYQPSSPVAAGTLYAYLHSATAAAGFASPVTYAAGNEPLFLASADLNGDGLPDVVSASAYDGNLSIYLDSATTPGTFGTPTVLAAPGASQVVIADLNGDGKPDLLAADYSVHLFLQDATTPGTFLAPLGLSSGGANWVAVGDLNHDGMPDVVVTDATGVKVFFHVAPATGAAFGTPLTVFTQTANPFFSGANLVAIGDFNGDGYLDLAITDPGPPDSTPPSVYILLQDAANPGSFLAPVAYSLPMGQVAQTLTAADLNGDGRLDLVIGDERGVNVLLASATTPGTFGAASYYATPYGAYQVGIADVNGDGLPDIVTTNTSTAPLVAGVYTTQPGVLLQDAANPGSFLALQDLP